MAIHAICIGTELLTGEILNTNFQYLAIQLEEYGLDVASETTVPDTPAAICEVLESRLSPDDLVITIGGLGPTKDDLTKETVVKALGLALVEDPDLSVVIEGKFSKRRCPISVASREKQAMVPKGADVLPNDWGIAPGLWCETAVGRVCMLPGPPREFEPVFDHHVMPRILKLFPPTVIRQSLAILGVGESVVEERADAAVADIDHIELSYCVKFDHVQLRVSADRQYEANLNRAIEALQAEFGIDAVAMSEDLALSICQAVRKRGGMWGTAESCTGGWIAKNVTDHAGVSDVFAGGVVTYSNEMKMQLLGVQEETLALHGAVSQAVVGEMAAGLVARYGLLCGVAVTGIAGPTGGTPDKPVGTVWIGSCVNGDVRCTHHLLASGRRGMRERTVTAALNQLRRHLQDI